jgi:hypothetical protein
MFSRMYVAAALLVSCCSVAVASTAIGTASAPGKMTVDGYSITGNATLFDGTAVQTANAIATVRLNKGTEVRLGSSSLGTLYHDHMVLAQGKSEVSTSDSYRTEASGFQIVPVDSTARAVVAVIGPGKMQVASVTGAFNVVSARGNVLGRVSAGKSLSFAMQDNGTVTVTGVLTKTDGHYYITDSGGMHEIVGKDVDKEVANKGFDKYVGKTVTVTGRIDTGATPTGGAVNVIDVSNMSKKGGAVMGAGGGGGAFAGETGLAIAEGTAAAAFLGWGIYEAGSNASR